MGGCAWNNSKPTILFTRWLLIELDSIDLLELGKRTVGVMQGAFMVVLLSYKFMRWQGTKFGPERLA